MDRVQRCSAGWIGAFLLAAMLTAGGCGKEIDVFPEPGNATETVEILRTDARGCVAVSYSSYPLRPGSPPDGVRAALMRALGQTPCSAASFFWSERVMAERWINDQLTMRRNAGLPQRLILAGHGLGATEAAETAKDILARDPSVEIVLLLTVDAVKTGRLSSTAGTAGTAIANHVPGLKVNLVAYDSAPVPDGMRFWAHVNYYQARSESYHGGPMAGAENHRLEDWTGLLNHANADDFAMSLIAADIRVALQRGMR